MAGKSGFPGPYVKDVRKDDSMMVYRDFDRVDIGMRNSNSAAREAVAGPQGMTLQHVGDSAGSKRK